MATKTGRPSKLTPSLAQELVAYFEAFRDEVDTRKEVPFLSAFARSKGLSEDSLLRYSQQSEEFCGAYKKAKAIQKEILILGGLKGYFNPTFAIFTAKNITDMRDGQALTVKDERIEKDQGNKTAPSNELIAILQRIAATPNPENVSGYASKMER